MTRALLLALVLCLCGFAPAHAQSGSRWEVIHRSDQSTISYDTTTFTVDDEGVLTVWIQHTYPQQRRLSTGESYDRKRTEFLLDCENGKVDTLQQIFLLGTDARKLFNFEEHGLREWVRPAPETELEFFLNSFCDAAEG